MNTIGGIGDQPPPVIFDPTSLNQPKHRSVNDPAWLLVSPPTKRKPDIGTSECCSHQDYLQHVHFRADPPEHVRLR
jgi:hypothetical protein